MRRAALALLVVPALASASDRLGIELLASEQPIDGAFAYERACWRLGADLAGVTAVQPFEHDGARWVRLAVDGNAWAQRCLEALEPGRRGVDGSVTWFDGFAGGLIVPSAAEPERIADTVWFDPARTPTEAPVDAKLLDDVRRGDGEALGRALALPPREALAFVRELTGRKEPREAIALEAFARKHPHWRIRRAALAASDPTLAFELLTTLARTDGAWEVRHGALERLGAVAAAPLAIAGPRSEEAATILRERARSDDAWEVRRVALWQLSTAQVAEGGDALRDGLLADAEPRVRAAALEVLTGAGVAGEVHQLHALDDVSPEVRAMAAYLLARAPSGRTAARLWTAMNDSARAVRIAASAMLPFVEIAGLEPVLWRLFLDEAERVDAQSSYLARLADALGRQPQPALAGEIAQRLDAQIAPAERRILARLYGRIAPAEALARFQTQLASTDAPVRSIAVDAIPDTPATRTARLALLDDADADVRAGAVLGLCRLAGDVLGAKRDSIDLAPGELGFAAAQALARCGVADEEPKRLDVALAGGVPMNGPDRNVGWPATAACALLVASIIGLRLSARRA